jgi:hypothetical protein
MGEIHGWVELGTVSTDSAAFVIVDPAYSGLLHDAWLDHLDRIGTLRGPEIPPTTSGPAANNSTNCTSTHPRGPLAPGRPRCG